MDTIIKTSWSHHLLINIGLSKRITFLRNFNFFHKSLVELMKIVLHSLGCIAQFLFRQVRINADKFSKFDLFKQLQRLLLKLRIKYATENGCVEIIPLRHMVKGINFCY